MSNSLSGPLARKRAVEEIGRRVPRQYFKEGHPARVLDLFGSNTFNFKVMKERLAEKVYERVRDIIAGHGKIDASLATEVARAAKSWAIERGATHFCHWFQPHTGLTAEKHDAFLTLDREGQPIEGFSGSQLIQSEPDASSFPSGGMRSTFEARGYTAWDPSSPMFLMEGPNGRTLCIPSVFISYHGQALDQKTPLLRSMEVINQKALRILKLFGNTTVQRVAPTVGPEQEYFLIDKAFYHLRPDLILAGRTVLGAAPPKGQELEDHYFGSIRSRVLAFMQEAEQELFKLGVPVKTRHNEVAPGQFECAPVFEEANLAADHNQMVMEIFRRVAAAHDLALLLHEKPFAGVNGSGKHNNWSLQDSDGVNLLDPGHTPDRNLQFLVFLVATLKAVYRRAGLLRAAIASSGNDHRLGANEAPPAIISVFLGKQLSDILDSVETGQIKGETTEQKIINLGVSKLPEIAQDYTDRNRTSPFAFTGNKFEFRAVGSSQSISWPIAVLNAAVAEALDEMADQMEERLKGGMDLKRATMEVIRQGVVETKPIRFEGNNYSEEWRQEAERRGLPNLGKAPEALAWLIRPESLEFFERMKILQREETEAFYHIKVERYLKDIDIEIQLIDDLARTMVLPAALRQQSLLSGSIKNYVEAARIAGSSAQWIQPQMEELETIAHLISDLRLKLLELDKKYKEGMAIESLHDRASFYAYQIMDAFAEVRKICVRWRNGLMMKSGPFRNIVKCCF